MKAKTSLSLSVDLLSELDRLAGQNTSRSSYVEQILRDFVNQQADSRRRARQIKAINRAAVRMNDEMADALSFQSLADEA